METSIDLVLCRLDNGQKKLFQAPAYSMLSRGDVVTVKTDRGETFAQCVRDALHAYPSDDVVAMLLDVHEEKLPLNRVISRVTFNMFHYDNENEQEGAENVPMQDKPEGM